MKKRLLKGALILGLAIVVSALVCFVLAATDVIKCCNPFRLSFSILAIGGGAVFAVYGIVVKGGYELGIGLALLGVGALILLIGVLRWWIIVIIAIFLVLIALMVLLIVKADKLLVERTDEKKDFKPYSEVLKEKKEAEAKKADEPLPELKDYSDED